MKGYNTIKLSLKKLLQNYSEMSELRVIEIKK